VGEAAGNWLDARNKLFCADIQPKHWNDAAITLDGQTLSVAWVQWHFGGSRPFFVCKCGRRVLSYATRQVGLRYRLILKAQKVRERLGGDLGVANPFPAKPKRMHWKRYKRLRARHDHAVEQSIKLLKI
jgi:hypothetical protein